VVERDGHLGEERRMAERVREDEWPIRMRSVTAASAVAVVHASNDGTRGSVGG
jgi:hypothetical protein